MAEGYNDVLGNSTNTVTVASGAVLQLVGGLSIAQALTLSGSGIGGAGALQSSGNNNTVTGTITLAANATIANTSSLYGLVLNNINEGTFTPTFIGSGGVTGVGGVISGSGGLVQGVSSAPGDTILEGSNNFTGAVVVNYGILKVLNNNSLGNSSNSVTVNSPAALILDGPFSIAQSVSISGTGGGSGALEYEGGPTVQGSLTLNSNATINSINPDSSLLIDGGITEGTFTPTFASGDDFSGATVSGPISGSGGLTVASGTLALTSGTSNFTGSVAINSGLLNAQSNNALGSTGNTVTVASGAALQLQGGISIGQRLKLAGSSALTSVGGSDTVTGPITLTANSTISNSVSGTTLTLSGGIAESTFTPTFTGTGNISDSGVISGSGGLVKGASSGDTGTLSLSSGSSNFTGAVTVNDGVLNVSATGALGNSSTVTVASGAALQVQGSSSVSQAVKLAGTGIGATGRWSASAAATRLPAPSRSPPTPRSATPPAELL